VPRLRRISSGGALALAVNALLALAALGIAGRRARPRRRTRHGARGAGGSLSLSNSKEGQAIFTAGALRSGQETSGTVQIANTGSLPGALAVARTADRAEVPGPGGALLSSRLQLEVIDVTQLSAPVPLWTGRLADMPVLGVGALPAGRQRAFRFVATLPAGTGDNAFQGARLSVGFSWTAVASGEATATPTSTPTATPTPTAKTIPTPSLPTTPVTPIAPTVDDPTGAVLGAQLFPAGGGRTCLSRRELMITIRRPRGTAFKSLTIKVNRKTKVKLKGAKARKVKARISLRGLPRGKVTVRIAAVMTNGRKATSTRVYKTCAKKVVKTKRKKR